MSDEESSAEKSEQASPTKIRKAKEKGNVAKSRDVISAFLLAGFAAYLLLAGGGLYQQVAELLSHTLTALPQAGARRSELLLANFAAGARLIGIILGLAVLLTVVGGLVQVGFRIATDPVKPQVSRCNPAKGLKKMFKLRKLFDLAKSLLAIGLVAAAVFLLLRLRLYDLAHLPTAAPAAVLNVGRDLAVKLTAFVLPLFVLLAVVDFLFQRFVWLKDLRMTKDEVKREHKDQQGDPLAKSRRKDTAQELLGPDNSHLLKFTSLALTSSGGQLVALYHDPSEPLPWVILTAQGSQAEELLARAHALGVRVVQDDALTRQLFMRGRQGQYIPKEAATEVGLLLRG